MQNMEKGFIYRESYKVVLNFSFEIHKIALNQMSKCVFPSYVAGFKGLVCFYACVTGIIVLRCSGGTISSGKNTDKQTAVGAAGDRVSVPLVLMGPNDST